MRPEAAAGARGARGHGCPCPADRPRGPPSPPPRGPGSPSPWRPWTLAPRGAEPTGAGSQLEPGGDQQTSGSKGAFGFRHPVRLYLPVSKRQQYLQGSGEKVLASFPVQATLHFYNDGSDSEDGEPEEARGPGAGGPGDTGRGPGGRGRDQPTHPAPRSGGHGELGGKGGLPHGDSPGGAECSSSK
ncbi:protein ripply3 [Pipistrellus kuhlii]|uniref:Protein ripply3 n=1 Tax=Pipistrellus kuhlii TaxID=59472 RepID=A0A7J8AAI1_PIPKU|nr:protein ripply3 [Pipistrellus kuhlii]KAF6383444.1 ripply transcriptional repressor 3 [Pipistrellus kuhlii]